VSYRVISADSHPVAGAFSYSVGAPSPGGPPSSVRAAGSEVNPAIRAMFPAARTVGYVGLLLLVGASVVLALLWPRRLDRGGPTRFIWVGAALVAGATVLELLLQVPYVSGGGIVDIRGADIRAVLTSQYGVAHLIRLAALGATLLLLRPIVRGEGFGSDRVLLAVLGTIGVATWSVSGHPSASSVPLATVVVDMIHIASMSVWLGGLVMLIVFLLPRGTETELAAIIPVWSRWATYAVAALVLTGVVQALVQVPSVDSLVSTTYGWLLIAKLGLVAAFLAVASLSRRLVAPIMERTTGAAARLRIVLVAEAAIAALVLGLTSVLVQTTPAGAASTETATPAAQSAVMKDKRFTLTVDVVPATVGVNEIHLYATTPDGQPADVKQWTVRASAPARGIEPIDASVLPLTPDHATGTIGLPTAGRWTFTFTLRTSEIDQSTVTTEVDVRP
jgi:copper transport protein